MKDDWDEWHGLATRRQAARFTITMELVIAVGSLVALSYAGHWLLGVLSCLSCVVTAIAIDRTEKDAGK